MTVLSWKSVLFQLLLAGGGITIFTVGAFVKNKSKPLLFGLAIGTVLSAAIAALLIDGGRIPFFQMLDVSDYARFFNVLFGLAAFFALLFSHQHAGLLQVTGDEFYGLMILAVLGMSLVAGANHWLVFFLGFELLSLAFYILIAMRRNDGTGNEAALKYLVMGMVSGGFLAFGIAVFYAASGTLDMPIGLTATKQTWSATGMLLSLALILTAVGFKISLVPFHLWTPDVYQGAPTPVTALLTTGSKIAVFAGLLRILMLSSNWLWERSTPVLWTLAAATLLTGSITALAQTRIKRLLAYSSVAQMGYAVMGVLAIKEDGGLAVMFYFAAYALMDLGAFGVIATLCASPESDLDELDSYRGLGYSHPWQAALLSICLLSLAGLPPTAGFIGKFMVFKAVLQSGYSVLAAIGIASAILSIFVYLKVIVVMFMRTKTDMAVTSGFGTAARVAFAVILFGVLWAGIFPSPLQTLIARIVASIGV
jgi:NADH-quinone oxidoreductase subunit N